MEKWVIKNRKADFQKLMEECGISEVLARCLVNRGLEDVEAIKEYLNPQIEGMHSPLLLKDIDKACNILEEKIREGKRIRIIGDYDVDGVVSTYVLYRALTHLGARVDYEIPDRIKDGYGMNIRMVDEAFADQVDTLLTCDNGIVAMEQIARAKEYGMTVIVTDHHNPMMADETKSDMAAVEANLLPTEAAIYAETAVTLEKANLLNMEAASTQATVWPAEANIETPGIILPRADAIINPKQPDCSYPFEALCGATIAYKLVCALLEHFSIEGKEELEEELLSYVAIATVCDVMDLVDENRIIVKHGLRLLKKTKNKGLLALMDAAGIDKEQLSSFHLGFVIGPCLNASGRLNTAKKGLELLLSETEEEAVRLATEVRDLNNLRKEMTASNVEKAIRMIEESDLKEDKVLVVYLPDCHESIAGIIAGRVREHFNKPALVLTDAQGCVKGSGRSIEHYNMVKELSGCKELFLKMGGHPMAAGVSLLAEQVEPLRRVLNEKTTLTEEMLVGKVAIDILLPLGYISEELVHELKQLEPFGKGNEKPLFAEKDLKIKSAFVIGKNASGIRLRVENGYGRQMEALYFGNVEDFFGYLSEAYGEDEVQKLKTGRGTKITISLTYFPKVNEYNGFKSVQLMIQNYR